MSKIKIIDYHAYNETVYSNTAEYNLKIDLPSARHYHSPYLMSSTEIAYFGYPKGSDNQHSEPLVFYENQKMTCKEFSDKLKYRRNTYDELDKYRILVCLNMDKSIMMRQFDSLKNELIENNFNKIMIGVNPNQDNPCYGTYGILVRLPFSQKLYDYYEYEFEYKKNKIIKELLDYTCTYDNLLILEINPAEITMNQNLINENSFRKVLYNNLKNLDKILIELKIDGNVTIERFITILDDIKDVLIVLRNQESKKMFQKKYSELNEEEKDRYFEIYRMRIIKHSDYYKEKVLN
ncbi:MAG: hypothetical protein HC906_19690 [Bacteroidales bacterium]|nr:hypothetical protein [Bacteroidales bacterium]